MNVHEWLEELELLRKAATPGPWKQSVIPDEIVGKLYHDAILDENGKFIAQTCWYKSENYEYVKDKKDAHAAYIVAACNAVPRLVEMLRLAVGFLDAVSEYRRSNGESVPDIEVMQLLFTKTEPKE